MSVIIQEVKELEKKEELQQDIQNEEEDNEIVYDSEFERVKDQYKELEEVFKNFAAKEASQSENAVLPQTNTDGKVSEKQEETAVFTRYIHYK